MNGFTGQELALSRCLTLGATFTNVALLPWFQSTQIKLLFIFQTPSNLSPQPNYDYVGRAAGFRNFSIRPESKPHNFLSSFTRGAAFPASAAFFLHQEYQEIRPENTKYQLEVARRGGQK